MKLTNKLKLRKSIKNNKLLYAILRVIRHRNDEEYLELVSLQNAPQIFKRENSCFRVGKGRTFYLVEYPWKTNGFFAIMRKVLSGCAIADSMGLIPYVNIENSIFNVPGGYNGINNMFEYYFKNTSLIGYQQIIDEENYIKASYSQVLDFQKSFGHYDEDSVYSEYVVDEDFLRYLGSIACKYVVLQSNLKEELYKDIQSVIRSGFKTVAVHFRGSDFLVGIHGHPVAGKLGQYFDAIDIALEKGYQKIFLATDDANSLSAFQEKYGDRIIYFKDVQRTSLETGVHFQSHERNNDQYYLGLEVLRDMLAISSCEGLIAGLSQVSIYARIQKYANGQKYEYQNIIDNGLYLNDTQKAQSYYKSIYKRGKVKTQRNK